MTHSAGSSNGRIADSESAHLGSNPSPAANEKRRSYTVFLYGTSISSYSSDASHIESLWGTNPVHKIDVDTIYLT